MSRMRIFEGRFAGRTAVVTGGASGLGRDVARRIAAEGGRVSIWDLNADLVSEASNVIGASHVAVLDVADYRAVSEAAVSAHNALGRIDVLVNSAGITGATAAVHEFPVENWIRVMEVNLHGTFYCCRAVVPFMLASGVRPHSEHLVRRRKGRQSQRVGLFGIEGGSDWSDQVARKGTCNQGGARKLHHAGDVSEPDSGTATAKPGGIHAFEDPDGPAWRNP